MDEALRGAPTGTMETNPPSSLDVWSKLPPELISYIIELSLPETASSMARMKAIYSTRMVARMWRNTVDATPSLWNVVSSDLPLHVNSTAIQQSGLYPLDVYVTKLGFRTYPPQKTGLTQLLELAIREIGRWSTVALWLPSLHACSLYLASPAPLLRNLRVTSDSRAGSSNPVVLFGGIAPKLEALKLYRLPLDWTSSFIHGLRELDLSSMRQEELSAKQVLGVLATAPLLERLAITNSTLNHHQQSVHTPPTILHLPGMKTIRFVGINTEATAAILSSVRAPNLTGLAILDWWGDEISIPSFPEPSLSHFSHFQRLALSANKISAVHFFDDRMEWECPLTGLGCLEFELDIPYEDLSVGVGWVTGVVGLGTQELVHSMEVELENEILSDDDVAMYYSFSRCESITKLTLNSDHLFTRPILELLGAWRESDDGTGRLPAFPGLQVLVLAASNGWSLDDLETLVSRRFGEWGDRISQHIPNLSIILQALPSPEYGPGSKPDLAQLQRLRGAKGVERLSSTLDEGTLGMLAVVYDDDTKV